MEENLAVAFCLRFYCSCLFPSTRGMLTHAVGSWGEGSLPRLQRWQRDGG